MAFLAKPPQRGGTPRRIAALASGARPGRCEDTAPIASRRTTETPFDREKIRRLCRGDAHKLEELLTLFLSSSEELLAQLAQALEDHDLPRAARQAHQIKGATAYLGATEATALAAEVEAAAKAGDQEACVTAHEDLEAAFIRLSIPIRQDLEGEESEGLTHG